MYGSGPWIVTHAGNETAYRFTSRVLATRFGRTMAREHGAATLRREYADADAARPVAYFRRSATSLRVYTEAL